MEYLQIRRIKTELKTVDQYAEWFVNEVKYNSIEYIAENVYPFMYKIDIYSLARAIQKTVNPRKLDDWAPPPPASGKNKKKESSITAATNPSFPYVFSEDDDKMNEFNQILDSIMQIETWKMFDVQTTLVCLRKLRSTL